MFDKSIVLKIITLLFALFMGYIFYKLIETNVLIPNCIIKTENCVKIAYYSTGNSALANIPSSGYWIWYNDGMVYTFGQKNRSDCDPSYESVYVTDITGNEPRLLGFQCVESFDNVLKTFQSKSKEKYFYFKKDPKKIVDLFEVLRQLQLKNIITVKTS
jgi:hypothetical protein